MPYDQQPLTETVVSLSHRLLAFALLTSTATLGAQGAPPPPATPPANGAAATPAAPAAPAYQATYDEAMRIGRTTVTSAISGAMDSLVALADPANGTPDEIRARLSNAIAQISMQLGAERRVIAERVVRIEGRIEYQRTAEYEMVPVPLVFRVIMGAQGKWRGFTANTEENTPAGDEVKP